MSVPLFHLPIIKVRQDNKHSYDWQYIYRFRLLTPKLIRETYNIPLIKTACGYNFPIKAIPKPVDKYQWRTSELYPSRIANVTMIKKT